MQNLGGDDIRREKETVGWTAVCGKVCWKALEKAESAEGDAGMKIRSV